MSDLISRQDAIDALAVADAKKGWRSLKFSEMHKCLSALPSVHPEFSNNSKELEKNSKELENKNGELISRQAAIDAIVNTVSEIWNHDSSEVARYGATFRQHEILDIIESLPFVQPEERCIATIILSEEDLKRIVKEHVEEIKDSLPRNGKWIDYSDEGYVECPFCHSATNCDGNKDELHYCFSCGADMREGDAE